jgi:hypothetical protein
MRGALREQHSSDCLRSKTFFFAGLEQGRVTVALARVCAKRHSPLVCFRVVRVVNAGVYGGSANHSMISESAPLLGAVAQQENVVDEEWPGRRRVLGVLGVLGVVMVLSIAHVAGYADYDGAEMFASLSIATVKSEPSQMQANQQPDATLRSPDVEHVKTLQINPCVGVNQQRFNTSNLRAECQVQAQACLFCVWVLQFDSEYRVNDIVCMLGPTFAVAAEAVSNDMKYNGTVLKRMLTNKPMDAEGKIVWPARDTPRYFEVYRENFEFLVNALRQTSCAVPGEDTLLVHIRAGDNLGQPLKEIKSVRAAVHAMQQYVLKRPYIKRIELSSVLHFGDVAQDAKYKFFEPEVGDEYDMTEKALFQNSELFSHFYAGAKATNREVWFTSHEDPDTDMCRYSKACHFFAMSLTAQENKYPTPGDHQSLSFSMLLRNLNFKLKTCRQDNSVAPEFRGGLPPVVS